MSSDGLSLEKSRYVRYRDNCLNFIHFFFKFVISEYVRCISITAVVFRD